VLAPSVEPRNPSNLSIKAFDINTSLHKKINQTVSPYSKLIPRKKKNVIIRTGGRETPMKSEKDYFNVQVKSKPMKICTNSNLIKRWDPLETDSATDFHSVRVMYADKANQANIKL
jgi:hypothetical protein